MTPIQFGLRFRDARKAVGLTQKAAAKILDIPQPRISEYERGRVMPPMPRIMELIERLGLEPRIIFPEFFTPRNRPG